MPNWIKYTVNQQVGEAYFVKDISAPTIKRRALFKCKCDNTFQARIDHVASGRITSCGCYWNKRRIEANIKHGLTYTPEYKSWCSMKGRCNNPNDAAYKNYGGRGIIVCENWNNSFEAFFEDMGRRPSEDYSLDRIDVNGNYEKCNCRWADKQIQSSNRRICYLEFNGRKMQISDWANELNISKSVIATRKYNKWPIEDILNSNMFFGSQNRKQRKKLNNG